MKVLTTLTVSGGLNMASAAKDVFTIGTPLENNDGNVDDLYVYANADFKNNVILGSSSVDVVDAKAQITASNGMTIKDSSLYLTGSSTIYYQGQDFVDYVLNNIGGGGGAISSLQSTGSGESFVRDVNNGTGYLRSLKSTSTISVIQQTNELELSVNPNLTLTSLTSQGTLVVSGNVQLGNDTGDTTTLSGTLKIPAAASVSGFNASSNKISLNNNNSQIFDDGNLHVHGSGSVWINSQNNNPIRLNEQSSGSVVAGNNFFMNSGYGSSALAFGVRSWVNFDGTGATGAKTPRGSGNVASVTKNSTGNYTVTFGTAMPDANYCLQATCKNDAAAESDLAINIHYNTTPSTGSFTIQTARYGSGPVDSSYIMVCVIR